MYKELITEGRRNGGTDKVFAVVFGLAGGVDAFEASLECKRDEGGSGGSFPGCAIEEEGVGTGCGER